MEVFRNLEIRANVPMFGVTDPSRMSAASSGVISTASANDSIRTDRLDYLIMNIIGLQRYCEDNSDLYVGLGKILDIIREKRNIM